MLFNMIGNLVALVVFLSSNLVAARCPVGFEPPSLDRFKNDSNPDTTLINTVIIAQLLSESGLRNVFDEEDCTIRFVTVPERVYDASLLSWQNALIAAVKQEIPVDRTIAKVWRLFDTGVLTSDATFQGHQELGSKQQEAERLMEFMMKSKETGFICDWGSDIYGVLTFDDDQASSNNPTSATNVHVRDPSVQAGVSSAFDVVLASGPAFTWLRRD